MSKGEDSAVWVRLGAPATGTVADLHGILEDWSLGRPDRPPLAFCPDHGTHQVVTPAGQVMLPRDKARDATHVRDGLCFIKVIPRARLERDGPPGAPTPGAHIRRQTPNARRRRTTADRIRTPKAGARAAKMWKQETGASDFGAWDAELLRGVHPDHAEDETLTRPYWERRGVIASMSVGSTGDRMPPWATALFDETIDRLSTRPIPLGDADAAVREVNTSTLGDTGQREGTVDAGQEMETPATAGPNGPTVGGPISEGLYPVPRDDGGDVTDDESEWYVGKPDDQGDAVGASATVLDSVAGARDVFGSVAMATTSPIPRGAAVSGPDPDVAANMTCIVVDDDDGGNVPSTHTLKQNAFKVFLEDVDPLSDSDDDNDGDIDGDPVLFGAHPGPGTPCRSPSCGVSSVCLAEGDLSSDAPAWDESACSVGADEIRPLLGCRIGADGQQTKRARDPTDGNDIVNDTGGDALPSEKKRRSAAVPEEEEEGESEERRHDNAMVDMIERRATGHQQICVCTDEGGERRPVLVAERATDLPGTWLVRYGERVFGWQQLATSEWLDLRDIIRAYLASPTIVVGVGHMHAPDRWSLAVTVADGWLFTASRRWLGQPCPDRAEGARLAARMGILSILCTAVRASCADECALLAKALADGLALPSPKAS